MSSDDDEQEDEEMRREVEESMLAWTDDVELNKFLVYAILEHVVTRLVPEIRGKTPSELLAERGVLVNGDVDGDATEPMAVQVNPEKHWDESDESGR